MPYPSSAAAIEERIRALDPPEFPRKIYGAYCSRFDLNHRTYEGSTGGTPGRLVSCLQIGTGTGEGRPRILIVGGMHAREWAPPDAIITFVEKLLEAYRTSSPMVYPRWVDSRQSPSIPYSEIRIPFEPDVKLMIERTELYVVPLANPDGRAYTMSEPARKGWRKNRRPASTGVTCPPLAKPNVWASNDPAGVDLNRNFEIAWDFEQYFSAAAVASMKATKTLGVSDSPCEPGQTFHGPNIAPPEAARKPEPETANIEELLTGKDINFYMDVHSAAGKLLFAWGMEQNQESDPEQSFLNRGFDRGSPRERDGPGTEYKEWLPAGSENAHQVLGDHLGDQIAGSTGFTANQAQTDPIAATAREESKYEAVQSTMLFGSPPHFEAGVSRDFAFSRQIEAAPGPPFRAKARDPIFSFTFECGRATDGGFQPDATTEYPKVEREVTVGVASFISYAATWRAPVPETPPATPPRPSPSDCFIATAAYGSPYHPKVRYLTDVRDNEIKTTEIGRRFMYGVDRAYYSFSPQVAKSLAWHPWARTAVRRGIVEPWVAIVAGAEVLTRRLRPAELRAGAFLGLVTAGTFAALGAIALLLFTLGRLLASLA